MSTPDIIILILFVPALIAGFTKGFIQQVVSIAAVFVSAWAAFHFTSFVATLISGSLSASPAMLKVTAFVIILVACVAGLTILGRMLTKMVKLAALGWVDRLLGLTFALFNAALFIGLGVLVFQSLDSIFHLMKPQTRDASVLLQPMTDFANAVFPYLKQLFTSPK